MTPNSEHGELVEKVARAINPGVWQLRDLMGNLDEWQAAEWKASLAAAERALSAIQQDTVAGEVEEEECKHEWRHYADFDRCFKCGSLS